MILLSIIPRLEKSIPDGKGSSLISSIVVKIKSCSSQGILDMVDDLSLDRFDIVSKIGAHELPHSLTALF